MTHAANPPLCRLDALVDGTVTELAAELDGELTSLVVFRQGEAVVAFHNSCPHAGRPLNWAPGRFLIENGLLICAAHGASFQLPGGQCVLGPCRGARLAEVPLRIESDEVFLGP